MTATRITSVLGIGWIPIALLACGAPASTAPSNTTGPSVEYTASAPYFHDDLVWYTVVRHRPRQHDEGFVVTCGTASFVESELLRGIDARDCIWHSLGAGGAASGGRARRRELAERATEMGALDRTTQGELSESDPRGDRYGSYYDAYPVRLRAGWILEIDHMSSDFDCYLFLMGEGGEELDRNDDGGRGLDSRIVYTAPTDVRLTIRAAALGSGRTGSYRLRIRTHRPGTQVPEYIR